MTANIWKSWSPEKQQAFITASNDHIGVELAKMFGICETTVKRIRRELGLRCSPELYLQHQQIRARKMIEKRKDPAIKAAVQEKINASLRKIRANERRRIRNCLPQRTQYKLLPYEDSHAKRTPLYRARARLTTRGYIKTDDIHILLYDDHTNVMQPTYTKKYFDKYRIRLLHINDYDPDKKILTIHDHLIAGERNIAN